MAKYLPIHATDIVHTAVVVDGNGHQLYTDTWPTDSAALTWAMHQMRIDPTAAFFYVESNGYTDGGKVSHNVISHVHGTPDAETWRHVYAVMADMAPWDVNV